MHHHMQLAQATALAHIHTLTSTLLLKTPCLFAFLLTKGTELRSAATCRIIYVLHIVRIEGSYIWYALSYSFRIT